MGLVQVPECAEVRLPQSRWRLSGYVGRGWSSLEIPAERSVYVVPVGEKWLDHKEARKMPNGGLRTVPLAFTVALSDKSL